MLAGSRIIWKDNATLRDITREMSDLLSNRTTLAFVAAQDRLFIGSDFPFNHRYIGVHTANAAASALSVALWDGTAFNAVAEIQDYTKDVETGLISLAQSGNVLWVPDETKTWSREASTENISDLSTLKIYDKFWARLSWSADLDATTELQYMGHKFSGDDDFRMLYPSLLRPKLWQAFDPAKTDWDDQHVLAAEQVIDALIAREAAYTGDQVLDPSAFRDAACHRAAQIIMNSFGDDWETERRNAEKAFQEALEKKVWGLDRDGDARLKPRETVRTARVIRR